LPEGDERRARRRALSDFLGGAPSEPSHWRSRHDIASCGSLDVADSHDGGLAAYSRLREARLTPDHGSGPILLWMPERRATYYCLWCRWLLADDGRTPGVPSGGQAGLH